MCQFRGEYLYYSNFTWNSSPVTLQTWPGSCTEKKLILKWSAKFKVKSAIAKELNSKGNLLESSHKLKPSNIFSTQTGTATLKLELQITASMMAHLMMGNSMTQPYPIVPSVAENWVSLWQPTGAMWMMCVTHHFRMSVSFIRNQAKCQNAAQALVKCKFLYKTHTKQTREIHALF